MRVAILGTGLMGTSIALGIRAHDQSARLVGYDRDTGAATSAQRLGAVHEVAQSVAQAVRDADMVVIATPVLAIARMFEEMAPFVRPDAVITDTGSSKSQIMRWAREYLEDHEGFVGSHPMAGKTVFGPGNAEATLFDGARWVVVPPVTASERAIETVFNLSTLLGAQPMIMDPAEHDAYVAAISHMPMLAATALFSVTRASEAWPELSMLAAGGFKDMTRLAGTDPAMAYDIAVTNRANIAHWIDRYVAALEELRRRLVDTESEDDLYRVIAATEYEHLRFHAGAIGREEQEGERMDSASEMMQDFIAGGWLREKLGQVSRDSERRLEEMREEDRQRRQV